MCLVCERSFSRPRMTCAHTLIPTGRNCDCPSLQGGGQGGAPLTGSLSLLKLPPDPFLGAACLRKQTRHTWDPHTNHLISTHRLLLSSQWRIYCLPLAPSKDHSHSPEGSQAVLALSSLQKTHEGSNGWANLLGKQRVHVHSRRSIEHLLCSLMRVMVTRLGTSPHYELILMTPIGDIRCPIISMSE